MCRRDANAPRRRFVAGAALAIAALGLLGCSESTTHAAPEDKDPLNNLELDGASPERLKIGITPSSGQETDNLLDPLVAYLKAKLEIEVSAETAKTYDDLAVMVNEGSVEVGIFSPLAYVKARGDDGKQLHAVPIATVTRRGSPTYVGYLAVRDAAEKLRSLKELKGTRIAWVEPSSTSGYLYPRMLLRKKGITNDVDAFFGKQVFAESHDKAVCMLSGGEVDVAAVASAFIDPGPQNPLSKQGCGDAPPPAPMRVIAKTDRIPLDCVVARDDLSRQLVSELRAALLALNKDSKTVDALEDSWGMSGFVKPVSYASVADALEHSADAH